MNLNRLLSFLTICGLLFFSTTGKTSTATVFSLDSLRKTVSSLVVVYGEEDTIDADVEDDEPIRTAETTVPSGSDILVSGKRMGCSRVLNNKYFFRKAKKKKIQTASHHRPTSAMFTLLFNQRKPMVCQTIFSCICNRVSSRTDCR